MVPSSLINKYGSQYVNLLTKLYIICNYKFVKIVHLSYKIVTMLAPSYSLTTPYSTLYLSRVYFPTLFVQDVKSITE